MNQARVFWVVFLHIAGLRSSLGLQARAQTRSSSKFCPITFLSMLIIDVHLQDKVCETEEEKEARRDRQERMRRRLTTKTKLVAHSTAMESIQAQTDPIDGEDNLP